MIETLADHNRAVVAPVTVAGGGRAAAPQTTQPVPDQAIRENAAREFEGLWRHDLNIRQGNRRQGEIGQRILAAYNGHGEPPHEAGYITRRDFIWATGYDDITEKAWEAFVGGDRGGQRGPNGSFVVRDLGHLVHYTHHLKSMSQAMGFSPDEFLRCEDIYIVPSSELLAQMITLNDRQLRGLIQALGLHNIVGVLRAAGINLPIDEGHGAEQAQKDSLLLALRRLQSAAGGRSGNPLLRLRAREGLTLLGAAMMQRINRDVAEHYDRNGLSESNYNLRNPLCARNFISTVFARVIEGGQVTAADMNRVEGFADTARTLRRVLGGDSFSFQLPDNGPNPQVTIDQFDPNSSIFTETLRMVEQGWTRREMQQYLAANVNAVTVQAPVPPHNEDPSPLEASLARSVAAPASMANGQGATATASGQTPPAA
ncbi:hypothetical protein HZB07_07445, partial [Candidatus Saganbacteria bacterium]|nr:hypothetical protein [Candidatus Saganbacteria bacterium]